MTIQELAQQAETYFIVKTRDNGEQFHCLRDDRPDWVQNLCFEAHDGEMPNDARYAAIGAMVEAIASCSGDVQDCIHEAADSCVDVYSASLLDWAKGNQHYVDRVCTEGLVSEGATLDQRLMAGQFLYLLEVGQLVLNELEERLVEVDGGTEESA